MTKTATLTKQHDALAKAVRNLSRTHLVGDVLFGIMTLLTAMLLWVAATPEAVLVCSLGVLFFAGMGWAMHRVNASELDAYRMRCSRYYVGFEQGYHDALACTHRVRSRDTDTMLGYAEGYRVGCDERAVRIHNAIRSGKAA